MFDHLFDHLFDRHPCPQLWKIDQPLFETWLLILNRTGPARPARPATTSSSPADDDVRHHC